MSEFRDIFAERVELEIPNDGRPWRIVYDPSRWPVAWHVRAEETQLTYSEIVGRLAQLLLAWDLTLDGKPLPCDEEALWAMPRRAVTDVYNHIYMAEMGAIADDGAEGKAEESPAQDGTSP